MPRWTGSKMDSGNTGVVAMGGYLPSGFVGVGQAPDEQGPATCCGCGSPPVRPVRRAGVPAARIEVRSLGFGFDGGDDFVDFGVGIESLGEPGSSGFWAGPGAAVAAGAHVVATGDVRRRARVVEGDDDLQPVHAASSL